MPNHRSRTLCFILLLALYCVQNQMKMKKRASSMKSRSVAKPFLSPLPSKSPGSKSGKTYGYNVFVSAGSSKKKLVSPHSAIRSPCTPLKSLATTSDLKDLSASGLEYIKRRVDMRYDGVLKEINSSQTRISKRFKIQTQACMELVEEAEKEYANILDKIDENTTAIKGSFVEFMAEVQATTSRVCKVSIPELVKSAEKAVESLHARYGKESNPA